MLPDSPNNCTCSKGYTWQSTMCALDCHSMTYSTGANQNSSACKCKSNYRWDWVSGQCVASTTDNSLAIGLGVGIPLGILAIAGVGGGIYLWDKKKKGSLSETERAATIAASNPAINTSGMLAVPTSGQSKPVGSSGSLGTDSALPYVAPIYSSTGLPTISPQTVTMPRMAGSQVASGIRDPVVRNSQVTGSQVGNQIINTQQDLQRSNVGRFGADT